MEPSCQTAGEGVNDATAIQQRLALTERQFIQQRRNEAMSVAETGYGAVTANAKLVLRELTIVGVESANRSRG